MNGTPGPVGGYVMGDTLNCFIDYTMWIDRDPAQPHRVTAHVQPTGVRPTIPGLPTPANCSATISTSTSTDLAPWFTRLFRLDRLDADQTGGQPVAIDLPYAPGAGWVNANILPAVAGSIPFLNFASVPNAGFNLPTPVIALG
ncbi:hypothetical protein [Nocardia sp. XZ_19_385]|uniref:hypothetical protein n=1 Tax=Nocardia sp. XZ_19_385 TaxID=2769488 RepID=UPI001890595E|nr:hypothetical protein [Nocardia sp. XZ_19_385]